MDDQVFYHPDGTSYQAPAENDLEQPLESDQLIEERRRWAVEVALKFCTAPDVRSVVRPGHIERWAKRLFNFAEGGSFEGEAS